MEQNSLLLSIFKTTSEKICKATQKCKYTQKFRVEKIQGLPTLYLFLLYSKVLSGNKFCIHWIGRGIGSTKY